MLRPPATRQCLRQISQSVPNQQEFNVKSNLLIRPPRKTHNGHSHQGLPKPLPPQPQPPIASLKRNASSQIE